jgi:hypothetical protein
MDTDTFVGVLLLMTVLGSAAACGPSVVEAYDDATVYGIGELLACCEHLRLCCPFLYLVPIL